MRGWAGGFCMRRGGFVRRGFRERRGYCVRRGFCVRSGFRVRGGLRVFGRGGFCERRGFGFCFLFGCGDCRVEIRRSYKFKSSVLVFFLIFEF